GRLPVDDERRVVLVYPAPADVERSRNLVDVETAEAQAALRLLERLQPPACPGLEQRRVPFVLVDRLAHALDLAPHPVEAGIRVGRSSGCACVFRSPRSPCRRASARARPSRWSPRRGCRRESRSYRAEPPRRVRRSTPTCSRPAEGTVSRAR